VNRLTISSTTAMMNSHFAAVTKPSTKPINARISSSQTIRTSSSAPTYE
jgi:hypothetical protein